MLVAERIIEVLEAVPDVLSIFDPEWRFVFVNDAGRATLQALGVDPHTVTGRVLWEVVPQLIGTKFETETKRAAAERRVVEYEEYQSDLGIWFENRIVPASGGFIIALSRDIAERKQAQAALQQSEAQFRNMIDAIPNLAWVANSDGWIHWYNQRWYEYTGTTPEQMEGWGWQSVHDPDVLPAVLERWTASISSGVPFEMEFPLRGADGVFRPFLTRVVPVLNANGAVVKWVGTNTDVSQQRAAVAEREKLLIAERAARTAAEEANRAKSQFLATMSHELRTPLNAIGGYAELLEIGVHGSINEEQKEYLSRIQRSQRALLSIINDILNYAKLEVGRVSYDLRLLPIQPLLDELSTMFELSARQNAIDVRVSVAPDCTVYSDGEKVQQVLINLCSNAIKAMPNGGELLIEARQDGDSSVITVTDSGIGIAPEKLDQIFEPFVQVGRDLTNTKEGAGLGLAISRELARGLGGALTVVSELGVGSTFTLRLPAAAP